MVNSLNLDPLGAEPDERAVLDLVRCLRPHDDERRRATLAFLRGCLLKPHVFFDDLRGVWHVHMGLVDGGLWASWTAAVRYAREWHENIYGMGEHLG